MGFSDIGFIRGAGNTNTVTPYSYLDKQAGLPAHYYRLRQLDLDNRTQHSNIIYIEGVKNNATKIWADETGNSLFIYIADLASGSGKLSLFNARGQEVLQKPARESLKEISVGFLPKGVYFYQFQQSGQMFSGKLILGR